MKNYIIGESHTVSFSKLIGFDPPYSRLMKSFCQVPLEVHGFNDQEFLVFILPPQTQFPRFVPGPGGDAYYVNPQFAGALRIIRNDGDTRVISLLGGFEHNACIFQPPQPYDFWLPNYANQKMQRGRQAVPFAAVEHHIQSGFFQTHFLLKFLRGILPALPIFHICPPPIIPSIEHIRRHPEIPDLARLVLQIINHET